MRNILRPRKTAKPAIATAHDSTTMPSAPRCRLRSDTNRATHRIALLDSSRNVRLANTAVSDLPLRLRRSSRMSSSARGSSSRGETAHVSRLFSGRSDKAGCTSRLLQECRGPLSAVLDAASHAGNDCIWPMAVVHQPRLAHSLCKVGQRDWVGGGPHDVMDPAGAGT
ncbi:hypothetical protein G6F22_017928 [Rhizopus arrhizus]|nr:hypothetical protein G6F22_017928 [Rhizopus arrhizus]